MKKGRFITSTHALETVNILFKQTSRLSNSISRSLTFSIGKKNNDFIELKVHLIHKQWLSQNVDKSYTLQMESTGSVCDSLQLRPFSKWELLLKERICSLWEPILFFKSSSLWYEKSLLPH